MLEGIIPVRSAEDIFAGRVRLTFAGPPVRTYELPTLVIEEEEKWLAAIDGQLGALLRGLAGSGDDYGAMIGLLSGSSDKLLDLLYAYDQTSLLPPRDELRRLARANELLRAVLEVWVAANPLVGIGLVGLKEMASQQEAKSKTNGHSPEPMNSPRRPTAGRRKKSGRR